MFWAEKWLSREKWRESRTNSVGELVRPKSYTGSISNYSCARAIPISALCRWYGTFWRPHVPTGIVPTQQQHNTGDSSAWVHSTPCNSQSQWSMVFEDEKILIAVSGCFRKNISRSYRRCCQPSCVSIRPVSNWSSFPSYSLVYACINFCIDREYEGGILWRTIWVWSTCEARDDDSYCSTDQKLSMGISCF